MVDALINDVENIITKIINILPKKILDEIKFTKTTENYDKKMNVFSLFEIAKKIKNYESIIIFSKEYKVSFIESLEIALEKLKTYFFKQSEKYIEDISLYLKNSAKKAEDLIILQYIPRNDKIIKSLSISHLYTIFKRDINYDKIITSKIPLETGVSEKYVNLFNTLQNFKTANPYTATISSSDAIAYTNDIINDFYQSQLLRPREIDENIKPSDLEAFSLSEDTEIFLYNKYMHAKHDIRKKEIPISIWQFQKKY